MDSNEPKKVFVRNDKGQVWGPLALPTIELLIDNSLIEGKLQVSEDGVNFAFPGRLPGIRRYFPRPLWGDVIAPGRPEDDLPPPVVELPTMMMETAPPPPPAAPAAAATPARAVMAGPGARQAAARPTVPAPGQRAPAPPPKAPPPPAVGAVAFSAESLFGDRPPAPKPAQAPAAPAVAPAVPPSVAAAAQPFCEPAFQPFAEPISEPPHRGDLADRSAIHLYYLAAVGELTGLLTLDLGDREIEIHFRKGNPEYVGSSHPDDSIGAFLLERGLARPEQISQAEAALDRFGGELVGALFGLGILNPGTAFTNLAQRAGALLTRALHAARGSFTYEAKELPPAKVMPLGNRWSLLTEQVRKIPVAELKRRLERELDLPVMKSDGRVPTSDLKLSPQETRAVGQLDGTRSLRQLMSAFPQDADNVVRVAFFLRELEIVSFAALRGRPATAVLDEPDVPFDEEPTTEPAIPAPPRAAPQSPAPPKAAPQSPAPPRAAPPSPAPPKAAAPPPPRPQPPKVTEAPVAAASPEVEVGQLKAMLAKQKEQNLFEILGLSEKAEGGAIKIAYFKLAKLYHPDTVPSGAPPELGKLKAEIFGKVGEAYRTLNDEKSRADYLEDLKAGGGGSEQVDIAQIFASEEKFQKGCIMVKARKFADAVKMLDEAITANPDEGEFYAWRGYARFFLNSDRKAGFAEAMQDINLCLKKNDRCAQAHYLIGQMMKLTGDAAGAAKAFQKCIQLQPEHTDALRELRITKKK